MAASVGCHVVPVANTTNAKALAGHLLKQRRTQQRQHVQLQQVISSDSSSWSSTNSSSRSQEVLLCCSSGAALYTAFCAAGIASNRAATLQQPQQLLLQPQLVRNAMNVGADGRCGAPMHQLHLAWVAAPHQQQQNSSEEVRAEAAGVAKAPTAPYDADSPAPGRLAQGQPQVVTSCDPAVLPQGSRTKRKSSSSTKGSSTSSQCQGPPRVPELARHMHGLLKGNWPAALVFQSPSGALLATNALVQARSQLQRAGLDLMLAVETVPAAAAPAVLQPGRLGGPAATAPGSEAAAGVTVWAVSCPALPASVAPSQPAQALAVPTAERVLARQQQERSRAKRLRARLRRQQQQDGEQLVPAVQAAADEQQHLQHEDPAAAGVHSSIGPLLDLEACTPQHRQPESVQLAGAAEQQQQQQGRQHGKRQLRHAQQLFLKQQQALSSMLAEAAAASNGPERISNSSCSGERSSQVVYHDDCSRSSNGRYCATPAVVQVQPLADVRLL